MPKAVFALTAAVGVLAAQPAAAEVVEQSEDHFVSRTGVTVTADPKATWLALIAPAKWWDKSHTWSGDAANLSITPQAGGCFCETLPERDTPRQVGLAGSAEHMVVVQSYPMQVLRMRGGLGPLQSEPIQAVLTIAMQPVPDGGTRMVWEYVVGGPMRYEVPVIAKAVDGILAEQLGRLADLLGRAETPKPAPAPTEKSGDAETVEDAIDAMDPATRAEDDQPSAAR